MKKSYYFYLLILSLLAGSLFIFTKGNWFSKPVFTSSELCELLHMNENQRAEIMFNRKYTESQDSAKTVIFYKFTNYKGWIRFYTGDLSKKFYSIEFASLDHYNQFIKSLNQLKKDAVLAFDGSTRTSYNISDVCQIVDFGFIRSINCYKVTILNPELINAPK